MGGFKNWKKLAEGVKKHIGNHNSSHRQAEASCASLLNQRCDIQTVIATANAQQSNDNTKRPLASIDVSLFLAQQGLPFRGHDESEASLNRGNFLELLEFVASYNDDIKNVVLNNAPQNLKLTSPDVQKQIIHAAAQTFREEIVNEIRDSNRFSIIVDEARDVSTKEQMAIVLRYMDRKGVVKERFLELVHVRDTESSTLFHAIKSSLALHHLDVQNMRGQGYDGASNMTGEHRGLKSLILEQNPAAFFVYCWAHRLQLSLVSVARRVVHVNNFFFHYQQHLQYSMLFMQTSRCSS